MKNFLNTPAGSWLKVFFAAMLVFVIKHGSIYGINWQQLIDASIMGVVPVIFNYINPADTRYGVNKDTTTP